MTPASVLRPIDAIKVRQKLYGKPSIVENYKYHVGDHVRISKARKQFKKGYLPNWTEEVFIITKRKRQGTEAVYVINDLNGEQIEGTFYQRELQRTYLFNCPRNFVLKVLRKKKQGKKTLHCWRHPLTTP